MQRARRLILFVAIAGGVLCAPSGVRVSAEEAASSSKLLEVAGTITAVTITGVEGANGTLTLDRGAGVSGSTPLMELAVDEHTVISKGGVRLALADLQPSEEEVTIRYVAHDGGPLARTVIFQSPPGLRRISGALEVVDPVKGELTLKPRGLRFGALPIAFLVNESTLIAQDGERRYLTNLKIGDQVTIQYLTDNDQRVAHFVSLVSPKRQPLEPRAQPLGPQRQAPGTPGYAPSRQ